MTDFWIYNGTQQSREIRATLVQTPVFVRPGEQLRVMGDADGIEGLLEHMRAFGAIDGSAEDPMPFGLMSIHTAELKNVETSGILEVPAPPKSDDPQRPSVEVPTTTGRGKKSNDGVEK